MAPRAVWNMTFSTRAKSGPIVPERLADGKPSAGGPEIQTSETSQGAISPAEPPPAIPAPLSASTSLQLISFPSPRRVV